MNTVLVLGDFVRIKNMGEFPGCCHSETIFAAGEPCQGSGPEKALQVYYKVEFASAKPPNEVKKRAECARMVPGLAEKFAVEENNFV